MATAVDNEGDCDRPREKERRSPGAVATQPYAINMIHGRAKWFSGAKKKCLDMA